MVARSVSCGTLDEKYRALRVVQKLGITAGYAVATAGATMAPPFLPRIRAAFGAARSKARTMLYSLRDPEFSRKDLLYEDVDIALPVKGEADEQVALSAIVIRPDSPGKFPTVLLRTPYNKIGLMEAAVGFVERGYAALCVDCRGRFQSGGMFFPIEAEAADAEVIIDWIIEQPWYDGHIAVHGESYNGFCAYSALAGRHADKITCIAPIVSASRIHPLVYGPSGAMNWELAIRWLWLIFGRMNADLSVLQHCNTFLNFFVLQKNSVLEKACLHTPAREIDSLYVGRELQIWQEGLRNPSPDSKFWQGRNQMCSLATNCPAIHIFTGFQDIFLAGALQDYEEVRERGGEVWLTIGDYSHWDVPTWTQQTIPLLHEFYDAKMKNRPMTPRRTVCCQIQGTEDWLEMDAFPPPCTTRALHLGDAGSLQDKSTDCTPLQYIYDPQDPTPAAGGAGFNPRNCGSLDQATVEARGDVLVFTTQPFDVETLIVGVPSAVLYVRSALEHFDIVARLCIVRNGKSFNISDGMARMGEYEGISHDDAVVESGGALRVTVTLGACAFQVRPGESLRLQVCSGAHPRWMRNYGTGEPLADSTTMLRNMVTLFRDGRRPSRLDLPVIGTEPETSP